MEIFGTTPAGTAKKRVRKAGTTAKKTAKRRINTVINSMVKKASKSIDSASKTIKKKATATLKKKSTKKCTTGTKRKATATQLANLKKAREARKAKSGSAELKGIYIKISKAEIDKMTLKKVLDEMAKAEYEVAFTKATWTNLMKRLDKLIKKK